MSTSSWPRPCKLAKRPGLIHGHGGVVKIPLSPLPLLLSLTSPSTGGFSGPMCPFLPLSAHTRPKAAGASRKPVSREDEALMGTLSKPREPSFLRALLITYGPSFLISIVFKLIQDLLTFVNPQLLRSLLLLLQPLFGGWDWGTEGKIGLALDPSRGLNPEGLSHRKKYQFRGRLQGGRCLSHTSSLSSGFWHQNSRGRQQVTQKHRVRNSSNTTGCNPTHTPENPGLPLSV